MRGVEEVHPRRADEVADEGVRRGLEELLRLAHLHDAALVHDDDALGEGQRLGLVVGHVDHRVAELAVELAELGAQLPLHLRVDDGQRLVEEDGVDVLPHHAAAEADLLLGVGGQAPGLAVEHVLHADHPGDALHALGDVGRVHAAVAEREGEVLAHGHRVVDDRELEDLGDVALLGGEVGHVAVAEEHLALRGAEQAGDDVEQRGLAAARGAEEGVGAAVLPDVVQLLERVVGLALRVGQVAVREVGEGDLRHGQAAIA